MNYHLKIMALLMLLFSVSAHSVFVGIKVVRHKTTGSLVWCWEDPHPDISPGHRVTTEQRRDIMSFIGSLPSEDVLLVAEDWTTFMSEMVAQGFVFPDSIKKKIKGKSQGSVLDSFVTECRAKGIPCANAENRDVWNTWYIHLMDQAAKGNVTPDFFKGDEGLKRLARQRTIQKINQQTIPTKVRSILLKHMYETQPGQVENLSYSIGNMMDSFLYQVDTEFVVECFKNQNKKHIVLLGGFFHTDAVYKLLLASGEYESIVNLCPPNIKTMNEALHKLIPGISVKKTIEAVFKLIKTKKVAVPVTRAKL